jgi:SanA protein
MLGLTRPCVPTDAVASGFLLYHVNLMWRKLLIAFSAVLVLCAVSLVAARMVIEHAAEGKTYSDVSLIPHRHVGLVPGCPKKIPGGWSNPFFENRMAAAAQLYFSGKVDYLVVSGDNHVLSYDEPVDMKNALVERGVPANRIYLDYAGFRTLDSVVRVKEIFGQENITIVSQNFQNERAIFLARHHGLDAIGFNAADVAPQYATKTLVREEFARVKAILDVYVFHKQPHFLGLKVIIEN